MDTRLPGRRSSESVSERAMRPLGQYLVKDGVLTRDQVERALALQRQRAARGQQTHFGEVLVEMHLATADQIQRALDRQRHDRPASEASRTVGRRSPGQMVLSPVVESEAERPVAPGEQTALDQSREPSVRKK